MAEPGVSFAGLLRKRRADAQLTQEDLAEACGLSPRTVSDLERGVHQTARKETARLLADALRLTGAARTEFIAVARGRVPGAIHPDRAAVAAFVAPPAPAVSPPRHGHQTPPGPGPGRVGSGDGERKQVTVLCCSTEIPIALREPPQTEELHLFMSRLFRLALQQVRHYGGTVSQFSGDGFMALFGAAVAHEDHARRAVLAALGVATKAEGKVSIGINSGLALIGTIGDDRRMDYIASGGMTVLAQRLNAAAVPGTVLVSQRTAELAGGYFQMAQAPPVQAEGQMIHPFRVLGPVSRMGAGTVWSAELSPFTGRGQELASLDQALGAVANGDGQAVGLTGDPGLGKSRLAWEFCERAEGRTTVLECRCLSFGVNVPYFPLLELVRNACGIAADDTPDSVTRKVELKIKGLGLDVSLVQGLLHAFGVAAEDQELAGLDPRTSRARTFHALRQLLIAHAVHRPLIVLVEDLQWSDQTSEDFLAEFTDELPSLPIMLLVTYRPGYRPPWGGKSFATQLALHPLAAADSEKVVAWVLGDDPRAAAIATRGEGNPFFLEELARAVRDQAADDADAAVPETVQQVLAARIDHLDTDHKLVLQVAAVLGREFPLELAEETWYGDEPLEARFQELKRLEFLRERHGAAERTFMFKHALTRDVAYGSLLHAHRRQLHARAAAALERAQDGQRFERWEALAYHHLRSDGPARAIPFLVAAGDRARDTYANQEAIAVYSQAIDLIEQSGPAQRHGSYAALCEGLGTILVRLSQYTSAIDLCRKGLDSVGDGFQRARFHILWATAEEGAHRYENALAQCDLAERALGPAAGQPGSQWIASWFDVQHKRMRILYWLIDTERYGQLIERVRPLVDTYGSVGQRVDFLLSVRAWNLRTQRYLASDETLELARAAHAAAQADPTFSGWTGFNLGFTLIWHEDLDEATTMLQESVREAQRRGDAVLHSRSLTYLMVADRKRGDPGAVGKAIGAVIQRARDASMPEYEAMAVANRAWVAWRKGDEEKAAADARAALEMFQRLPVPYPFHWMALWPLLAVALVAGQVKQAVEHARGMLPPPQQLLREPARALLQNAVDAWDPGQPARSEQFLTAAVGAAGRLGYL